MQILPLTAIPPMRSCAGVVRCLAMSAGVAAVLGIPTSRATAQAAVDQPVYVRAHSGWIGVFGHGPEYSRFAVPGSDPQFQDASHVLLPGGIGMMVTFVDLRELAGGDPLRAHAQWEADYWRSHAVRVDTATRADLFRGRSDVRVTTLTLTNAAGKELTIMLVGQRTADGVFVFAFSPHLVSTDSVVARLVRSLAIIHRPLTPLEVARISLTVTH